MNNFKAGDVMYDVLIIGGGVTGCAAAAELAKFKLKVCLAEKESDVCEGTSKANSAIIHAGFDAAVGSLKAEMNVRGSRLIPELSKKLDFAYKNNGAMVLGFDDDSRAGLEELLERGKQNGVEGLQILDGDEARAKEPALSQNVKFALYAPTSGIVCPFEMTLAFAENAADNGVEFRLSTAVTGIKRTADGFEVLTNKGVISTKAIFNCAGVYADRIAEMADAGGFTITPRKGEYMLMDKDAGGMLTCTIFQMPTKMGKGILVSPTVHGNLLAGPTAVNINDKENTSTTAEGYSEIRSKAALSVDNVPFYSTITSFTGLRAVGSTHDFIIEETKPFFFNAAGIESPGLSSAPAIAERLRELLSERMTLEPKSDHKDTREGIKHFALLSREEQNALIEKDPRYGSIVCRCETVTVGEIADALTRTLPATTLDGVKRRTRAGMGRCQAGFCSPKTITLIADQLGIDIADVRKTGASGEVNGNA